MNSEHPLKRPWATFLEGWLGPWLWVAGAILLLGLGGETAREFLRYERQAVLAGEAWRLVGAHLVHLGWPHLWLNLIALAILGNLFAGVLVSWQWWLGLLLSAAAIDAGLLLLDPAVGWYVGLSGVLHGIILLGGWRMLHHHPVVGGGLVAGVILKLAWEQWAGPLPFTEAAAAGPVLVNAHLYGAAGGALSAALLPLLGRGRTPGPPYNPAD